MLNGITNGVDLDEWDPEADQHTVASYSARDLSGKAVCKEALQKELGLEVNPDVSSEVQASVAAAPNMIDVICQTVVCSNLQDVFQGTQDLVDLPGGCHPLPHVKAASLFRASHLCSNSMP